MTGSTEDYAPHPHLGGRVAALRALAAWRAAVPGAPRVVVVTGGPGSGCSRLLTGFLMLCEPDYRKRLPLAEMDPSTVPPELPAPAVPDPEGLTAAQFLWLLAGHYGLDAASTEDVYARLAARDEPVTVVVPNVDRAGPVRATGEPTRLVREVLAPLAATATVRLLAELPRPLAAELAAGLPPGTARIIDLDEPEWADPEVLVLHAQAALNPEFGAPELPFTVDPAVRLALGAAIGSRAGGPLVVQLAVQCLLMAPEGFDPADESVLPTSVGEALDLHARRLGADPQALRLLLAPLALAEADGIPVQLWARLADAVAGRDMSRTMADGMLLAGPFVEPVERRLARPGWQEAAQPEGQQAARPGGQETAQPEGQQAARPGGQEAAQPEGQQAARPGGQETAQPEGQQAARPGGQETAQPEGQQAARPGGQEAGQPEGQEAVRPEERDEDGVRTLVRLSHPALGDEIRAGLPSVRAAQTQVAMALLEAVPEQDWGKADPYVRDHIAGHTLEAGLLPQLLTDPGLFVHADPVPLRAAVEAVPAEELGAPARTYLRTAPLLTRTQAPALMRAALLETAFVEDGLPEYADAVHRLGLDLPWRTLWSLPVLGVSAVTVGSLPDPEGPGTPVAVLAVPAGTPGAHPVGEPGQARSALLVHGLVRPDHLVDVDPARILRPSEEERVAAPLGLSRGADYLRVWDRASQEVVAALISDTPFTAADLSPDGILLVATGRGVKALRIRSAGPALAS